MALIIFSHVSVIESHYQITLFVHFRRIESQWNQYLRRILGKGQRREVIKVDYYDGRK